jgi:hypothetical protein
VATNAWARNKIAFTGRTDVPTRRDVLARYRHLRSINVELNSRALGHLSRDAIMRTARQIGLVFDRVLLCREEELPLALDLSLYTAEPGRSRAIDRFARSAELRPGSDEALVLEAMCRARFMLAVVERRHEAAGLIVKDAPGTSECWLVDEGLEKSAQPGDMLATRIFTPDSFSMTLGVIVPFNADLLMSAVQEVPSLSRKTLRDAIADRRFVQALYRVAIQSGVMEDVVLQDVSRAAG